MRSLEEYILFQITTITSIGFILVHTFILTQTKEHIFLNIIFLCVGILGLVASYMCQRESYRSGINNRKKYPTR